MENAINKAFVRTVLKKDPQTAFNVTEKTGVDFDQIVGDALEEVLRADRPMDPSKYKYLTAAVRLCKEPEKLQQRFTKEPPLNIHTIEVFLDCLPPALIQRQPEVVEWMVKGEISGSRREAEKLEEIMPGVTHEAIGQLNADTSVRDLPLEEVAERVSFLWDGEPAPQLSPDLWHSYLVWRVSDYRQELSQKLCQGLSEKQVETVYRDAIARVMAQGRPLDALHWACSYRYHDLKITAAVQAYMAYIFKGQFKEAADIAKEFRIPDSQKATVREFERLCDSDIARAIDWAREYKLPIPAELAIRYTKLRDHDPYMAIELLVDAGLSDLAKKMISRNLCFGTQRGIKLLQYYTSSQKYFKSAETAEDIGRALAEVDSGKWPEIFEWPNISLESDRNDFDALKSYIVNFAIKYMISAKGRNEIVKVAAKYLPAVNRQQLLSSARGVAMELVEDRDWQTFISVCEEWELADLLEQFDELEKLLPELPREPERRGARLRI